MIRFTFRMLLVVVFAIVFHCDAGAQNDSDPLVGSSFEIAGQVRFAEGHKTAERVSVRLEGFTGSLLEQTTTDSVGRFRFTRLRRGQYIVVFRAQGFREEKQQVEISQFNRRAQVMVDLKPETTATAAAARQPAALLDARVPAEARKEYEKARAALDEHKPERGIQHLERAVRIYPEFFDAQLLIGTTHMDAQQWEKAEKALRRALELNASATAAMVSLGEVERRQKKYTDAEKLLLRAVELDDQSWQAHYTLGRVYWERNDIPRAGRHIGRTLELEPDLPEAHLLGGNIFMRAGLPANALIEYEEYLRLAPVGEFAAQTQTLVEKLKKQIAATKK